MQRSTGALRSRNRGTSLRSAPLHSGTLHITDRAMRPSARAKRDVRLQGFGNLPCLTVRFSSTSITSPHWSAGPDPASHCTSFGDSTTSTSIDFPQSITGSPTLVCCAESRCCVFRIPCMCRQNPGGPAYEPIQRPCASVAILRRSPSVLACVPPQVRATKLRGF